MSELYDILVETPPTKVILLALDQGLWDCERSLAELAALCEANHMEAVAEVTQKRQTPETGIVLGSGKLEEAAAAAAELGAECAVFDGELTGSQIRNISTALGGLEVIDRTMLILEIFRSRAVTNEGKLQTELALLRYRLPRLQGMGESLSRQGGGGGGGGGARRGAGETKLELDRRHVHARIDALAEKLAEMEKRRGESRKARAKTGMPVVSLVGYTNVGKSSLMNALCGPSVAEADMLFATLDPTSRKLVLPSGMAVLLVDTVGFVSRLPHNLVEAFKSTLEEAAWSDVIVRVADAGDEQREEQLAVTDEVLDGLDCADIPHLTVYNKCDKPGALSFDPDILLTSAKTGYGLDKLLAKLDETLSDRVHTIRVLLPYDKLGLAAPMRERGSVQLEEYREDGLYLEGIVKTEDLHCFEGYLVWGPAYEKNRTPRSPVLLLFKASACGRGRFLCAHQLVVPAGEHPFRQGRRQGEGGGEPLLIGQRFLHRREVREHFVQLLFDLPGHKDAPVGEVDLAVILLDDHPPLHQQVQHPHHRGFGHAQLLGDAAGADVKMGLRDLIDREQVPQVCWRQFHLVSLSFRYITQTLGLQKGRGPKP